MHGTCCAPIIEKYKFDTIGVTESCVTIKKGCDSPSSDNGTDTVDANFQQMN